MVQSGNRNEKREEINIGIRGLGPGRPGGGHRMAPVVKPKNFKRTMVRLWKYFGDERRLLVIIILFILISSGIGLIVPYLIGFAIDAMSQRTGFVDFHLLGIVLAALVTSYFIDAVISFFQGWIMAGISQRIVMKMRSGLFRKFQRMPVSFFDTHTHGEIMSRISNDIDNVSSTIAQSTTHLMSGAITIAGSLIMMLVLSPLLTIASIITVPMVFSLTHIIAKHTSVLFKNQQEELGKLYGHIEETISGINVIKAFNHEDKAIEEFSVINKRLCEVGLKAQIWSGYIMPLMNVINNFGFAVVAGAGGMLAVRNVVTVGVIASFLSYSRQFARPLNDLANIFNTLQSAVAGAERVYEVLDMGEEAEDKKDSRVLENVSGYVIFENVSFGYRPDVQIIKDISFEVKKGSTIALVGPTGAGKTTIVNLLARFYDVSGGRILIDGRDIREYTRSSLRRCFGIVLQDTYLFSGSIRDNIRYGRLNATDDEIEAAAKMTNADVFIKRLPKGYDTMLTESGGNLSQGQRQLLSIARAVLANPPILILDEATSSVDTRTEKRIQEAMIKLMKGRTSFIIAHRLSTIRDADIIMVIDNGRIVEKGNHDELMSKGGVYYNMYFSQFRNDETG